MKSGDDVNHPPHYNEGGIETWDVICAKLTREERIGYLKGSILKYTTRANFKGSHDKDCLKLAWYSRRLKEVIEGGPRE